MLVSSSFLSRCQQLSLVEIAEVLVRWSRGAGASEAGQVGAGMAKEPRLLSGDLKGDMEHIRGSAPFSDGVRTDVGLFL